MFSKSDNGAGNIDTIIGPLVIIKGNLESKATIRVDGVIEGSIKSEGEVVLGKSARVKGDIKAKNILVGGLLEGNAESSEKVEVLANGQLIGDITAKTVVIDEGAAFSGTSRMLGKNISKEKANNPIQENPGNPQ